jgi:hypothetical protein
MRAGSVSSHPLNKAIGYRGWPGDRLKDRTCSKEVADVERAVQECIVAGTTFQSGALPHNTAAEPEILVELLGEKGVQVSTL